MLKQEKSAKVARQVFYGYLKEKKATEREEKSLLARDSKTFWGTEAFIVVFYFIWDFQCVVNNYWIRFFVIYIQNYQGLGKCYQPSTSADNTYSPLLILDITKNLTQ